METLLKRVGDRARELALGQALHVDDAVAKSLDELAIDEPVSAEGELALRARANLLGFGELEPFLSDPEVEEIWMNEPNRLFVFRRGRVEEHVIEFSTEQIEVVIDRMLRSIGRRIDRAVPFVDAPLEDGSRLHVVIPDVTRKNVSFNIRRFVQNEATLESLTEAGVLSESQRAALKLAIQNRETVIVSGATAAGKTTLLSALLRALPIQERIVSVEDTFEIAINNRDWVAMQTRPASLEGAGEIDMRRLIREALRMRPSRLVVGEVRGAEAIELLVALNSGIPGLCTVHSNSAEHALTKLMTLPLLGGAQIPIAFVQLVIGSTVGLIAHCETTPQGERRLQQLVRVTFQGGELGVEKVA